MALRVTETEAPIVRSIAGSLLSDAPVRARDIAINASDTGLGLFRLLVYVDGKLTEAQPFDASRPACADLNPASPDPYELPGAYVCPTGSTSRSFSLAGLPADGQHDMPRHRRGRRRQRHHRPAAHRRLRPARRRTALPRGRLRRAPPGTQRDQRHAPTPS